MNKELPEHLQPIVEDLCESGCQRVNEIIETLDNGGHIEETVGLSNEERNLILKELKNIMSVYEKKD